MEIHFQPLHIELAIYWMAGVLLHLGASCAKHKVSVRDYFFSRPLSTAASLLVSLGIAVHSLIQGDTEFMTYFGTAYLAESLINKFEVQHVEQTKGDGMGSGTTVADNTVSGDGTTPGA